MADHRQTPVPAVRALRRPVHPLLSRRWFAGLLLLAAALLMPGMARAQTATGSFNVTATVGSACSVSATNVAFGTYTASQLDANGSLSVTCTAGTSYAVGLSAGTGASATVAARRMTGPSSQTLVYSLYQDALRTLPWGSTGGVDTVAGVGTGATQSLSVYGRVPAAQLTAGAGSYSDTITVTVSY